MLFGLCLGYIALSALVYLLHRRIYQLERFIVLTESDPTFNLTFKEFSSKPLFQKKKGKK